MLHPPELFPNNATEFAFGGGEFSEEVFVDMAERTIAYVRTVFVLQDSKFLDKLFFKVAFGRIHCYLLVDTRSGSRIVIADTV